MTHACIVFVPCGLVCQVKAQEWDSLVHACAEEVNPFLLWNFLHALEASGSVVRRREGGVIDRGHYHWICFAVYALRIRALCMAVVNVRNGIL